MLPTETHKKFAVIIMYSVTAIVALWAFFRFLWGALIPFLIGILLAHCARPIVRYGSKRPAFPTKISVIAMLLVTAVAFGMLLYALVYRLYSELTAFTGSVSAFLERIRTDDVYAEEIISKINSSIPFADISEKLHEMRHNLDNELGELMLAFADRMSTGILPLLGGVISFVPNALLAFAATVISAYYFAIDGSKISLFFDSLLPKKLCDIAKRAKDELFTAVFCYVKAYGLLFIITFAELLAAFSILGVEYSALLALVIALLDALPIVGTGTALIPWGGICLLTGNIRLGAGLLISYLAITVIRQVIEPKIVGKSIGLHPLVTLFSMYLGIKLLGLAGIIVFPLAAVAVARMADRRAP